jgi:hypothetical protein
MTTTAAPTQPKLRRPAPGRSLAESASPAAGQWHPHLNLPLTPAMVSAGSVLVAWWLCDCGHVWQARVNLRTSGRGCPACAQRKRVAAARTALFGAGGPPKIGVTHPELAGQWHPVLNGALRPDDVHRSSQAKVWWQCPDEPAHTWEATVSQRVHLRSGCPVCANRRRSATVKATLSQRGRVGVGQVPVGPVMNRAPLSVSHPAVAAQWHPDRNGDVTPDWVTFGSEQTFWWLCPDGHSWQTRVNRRTSGGGGCPACAGLLLRAGTSRQEIAMRVLLAGDGFDPAPGRISTPGRARAWQVDAVHHAGRLVVEFDGHRWHRDRFDSDTVKTRTLTGAGWRVIRVREMLDPVGPHDLVLPRRLPPETVAHRTVAHVRKVRALLT